ncbi:uncharacterized protein ASPGLDRAFT_51911 [Aspergillus glaucus CBS 516.65]|uniref:Uncharacterized protein n=1 Tax=Aspergillus glaucus CBS 516.65 TaxID=1160497 RepID=A0A1L9V7U9_ASPGL|nr:hypothetical protein ASPGLDRAFT_51911 [Aspergillus glaucus CBS 516.65]OJJ80003.1 hypothetical protein ASPGLDRAFT_51911 [Aspergillus glaucus CBS 516.65]
MGHVIPRDAIAVSGLAPPRPLYAVDSRGASPSHSVRQTIALSKYHDESPVTDFTDLP